MFHRRALDTKVAVRKSAMQALQNVIYFTAPLYQEQVSKYNEIQSGKIIRESVGQKVL